MHNSVHSGDGWTRRGGFSAQPADFASAASRLSEAADGLAAAMSRTVHELEGQGSFWGEDTEFEDGYRCARRSASVLAEDCEIALLAMAQRLGASASAYQNTDADAAASFGLVAALGSPDAAGGRR